jgi:hypothetical protein
MRKEVVFFITCLGETKNILQSVLGSPDHYRELAHLVNNVRSFIASEFHYPSHWNHLRTEL